MTIIAKYIVILFGVFLIGVGFMVLIKPASARAYLRLAGSSNLINYSENTIPMLPAAAMILYADFSRFPDFFTYFGWFMILTSQVLYFVPRRLHHRCALVCADLLSSPLIRATTPFSMLFGIGIIYAVV